MQKLIKNVTDLYSKYATERNMFLLVVLFILVRLVFALVTGGDFKSAEDLKIAYNLAESGEYVLHEHLGPTAMKSPLYPVLLSSILAISGTPGEWIIVILQHILMGLVPIVLFKTARLFVNERRAFFAGCLFLLHMSYFYYPNVIEITNVFVPLLSLFLYQLLKSRDSGKFILLAFLSGLLVLLQPTIIPVLLMSAILIYKRLGLSKILQIALIISIMQTPWIYRNYNTFDKFIPTKSPFWMNLYIGILPESQESAIDAYLSNETISEIDSLKDRLNDIEMEPHYKRAFMSFWDEKSNLFTEKVINHAKYYWFLPPRYIDNPGLSIIVVRVLPNILLICLMLFALKRAFKENKSLTVFLLATILFYTTLYSLTAAVNIRYKLDVEFLQMFIAMYALKSNNSPE